ncbi:MAG: protein kinase [Planctomycetes bacterium]|nr:protein kinase [Planctomycetota bacterium]
MHGQSHAPPRRLGQYRIVAPIGRGTLGEVYKGYDESLDRAVAIKVLPARLASDAEIVRRFRAEAISAAKVVHPNVVPIHFIGREGEHHFLVRQYVEGESLAERLAHQGRMEVDETLQILEHCLTGLSAVHAQGLIHGGIKPGNIVIEGHTARAVLVDLGLGLSAAAGTTASSAEVVLATVDYVPPEQARHELADARADIYSLGVLAYHLLSGRLPFEADTGVSMVFQHAYEQPYPLAQAAPHVPLEVIELVERMTAKSPAARYQTCRDVLADVRNVRSGAATRQGASGPSSEEKPSADPASSTGVDWEAESPVKGMRWAWARLRSRLAAWFTGSLPEPVRTLRGTTQEVDGAVAGQQRRRNQLLKVRREGKSIIADLARQIQATLLAATEAGRRAEAAPSEEGRRAARAKQQGCEESVAQLRTQRSRQQHCLDDVDLQLFKADAALARLRSQRDALKARLQAARAQLATESGWKRARRQRHLVVILVGSALLLAISWWWRADRSPESPYAYVVPPLPHRAATDKEESPRSPVVPSEHQVRVLRGHAGPVESVAVSPDGLVVASASLDGTVKLWDPATGEVRGTLDVDAGPVLAVAFCPDGTMLASMSRAEPEINVRHRRKTVTLWDVATWEARRTVEDSAEQRDRELEATPAGLLRPSEYGGDAYSLAFSPDGSILASPGECHSARLWDTATGRLLQTLEGDRFLSDDVDPRRPSPREPLSVRRAAGLLSRQGSAGFEGTPEESINYRFVPRLNEYGAAAGRETIVAFDGSVLGSPAPGKGHQEEVCAVAFSPDGATLATASWDMKAGLWDVATGERRKVLQAHVGEVWSVSFSPDGARVATAAGDGAVKIWDAATGQVWRTLRGHADRVRCVVFSPDGARLASAGDDGAIKLWDADSGCAQAHMRGHDGPVRSVAFSPDGLFAYSAGGDSTVRVWKCPKAEPPRPRPELSVTTPPASQASPPRRELGADETARFEGHEGELLDVRFTPDGGQILSAAADQTVRLWDLKTRAEVRRFVGYAGPVGSVDVSPDGKWFAAGDGTGDVVVQELSTGQVVRRFQSHAGRISAVRFFADGGRLASGAEDGRVKVWDLASGGQPHSFTCGGPVVSLACPRRGYFVMAAVGKENVVQVWYPIPTRDANQPDATYEGHSEAVHGCAFFGDFKRIFAFSTAGDENPNAKDFAIRMWGARSGRLDMRELIGHTARPWGVDCSPDNSLLASGGADRTVRLWDIESGREVRRFEGHAGPVRPVAFSPDGRSVVSGSADKTVRVWQIPERPFELAAARGPSEWEVPPGAAAILTFEKETLVQGDGRSLMLDSSEAGNHFSSEAKATPIPGKVGSGLDLDGLTLRLPRPLWGAKDAFTLCAWVYVRDAQKPFTLLAEGPDDARGVSPEACRRIEVAGEIVRTLGGWFRPPAGTVTLSVDGSYLVEIKPKGPDEAEIEVVDARTLYAVGKFSTERRATGLRAVKASIGPAPTSTPPREIFGALAPDGRQLALAVGDRIRMWDVGTGRKVSETTVDFSKVDRPLDYHDERIYSRCATLSRSFRYVASALFNQRVFMLGDLETGKRRFRETHPVGFTSIRISPRVTPE